MTLAVLLDGDPMRSGDRPDLARLLEQLRAAGAGDVRTVAEAGALSEIARTAAEPLLLVPADLVAHGAVLWHVLTDPGGRTTALVAPVQPPATGRLRLRELRGMVTSVVGPNEPATTAFAGVLKVAVADLPVLVDVAERTMDIDQLLVELLHHDVPVSAHPLRILVARRAPNPAAQAAAVAEVAAVDEEAARLRLAVKERDDFFTTFFVSTWSPIVTRFSARLGLTPSAVTAVSVLLAIAAAAAFAYASRPAMIFGAVLLYLGFVLDCVDGQVARYTRSFSPFGGWLDTMADRAKEYVVYAGLGASAVRSGYDEGWWLALAAMILQTVRHMTDTWYGALHDAAVTRPDEVSRTTPGGLGARLGQASDRVIAGTGSPIYWLKRIVVFPIGERWAFIALTAIFFDGRTVLVAVLTWASLAAIYTLALRGLRAWAMRVGVLATLDTARHRDDGWLARRLPGLLPPLPTATLAALAAALLVVAAGRSGDRATGVSPWIALAVVVMVVITALSAAVSHTGPLDWLVPAALRAAEYLAVVGIGVLGGVAPTVIFALIFVLTMHHYDLTARMEKGAPERSADRLVGWEPGWDGRPVVLVLLSAGGGLLYTGILDREPGVVVTLTTAAYLAMVIYTVLILFCRVRSARARAGVPVPAGERGTVEAESSLASAREIKPGRQAP